MLEVAQRPVEVLCHEVENVKEFCCLGDEQSAGGGCGVDMASGVGIGRMRFGECEELLRGRRFSLGMREMVYRSCVRSAVLYGGGTWCLRESEVAIL